MPWSFDEFYFFCKNYKPLIQPKLVFIAEHDSTPIGVTIALPNYNVILKLLNGKLGLLGMFKFLYYKRKIKSFRAISMGVKKEFQNSGAEMIMLYYLIKTAVEIGYEEAECSWILEENVAMLRVCEAIGGKLYKIYRIYGKEI